MTDNLHLEIASGDPLDVRHFSVHERLSSLYAVHLVALSTNIDLCFEDVVGQPATFTLNSGPHVRTWSGLCNHLQQIGVEDSTGSTPGVATYEFALVPTLWLLTQRRNYRMFQQESEIDIARKLLGEWEVPFEEKLTEPFKARKYRVQYAETDYAFFCRMLEDVGVTFYFGNEQGETRLVLADAPHANPLREPAIAYRDKPMATSDEEHVTHVRVGQRVRPGKYTMRDHDYRLPPSYPLMKSARVEDEGLEARLERYHYTPGAFLLRAEKGEDTPVADDRGRTRSDEKEGEALVSKRLAAKRVTAKVCSFETNAHDLSPGMVMGMRDHPKSDLGTGKRLLVRESTLQGTTDGEWAHHCEVVSAEVVYRPELSTPRPRVSGVESATVVGPPGEGLHCDEFGRVRVHFHWDRESQMNEKSSCWIHVSQPWGGAGYGGMNLPRVGQEVLVDFLGGDPDRPVIVGRVYTNLQKVPYKLPENKTQSGWKSESYPGGGGSNEFRFEDAKGREQVYIQAEKDLKKLVKDSEEVTIGANRTKTVKGNDALTVLGNRTKMVRKNEQEKVAQNKTTSVGINRATQVGMSDTTTVGEMHSVVVSPPGEGWSENVTRWLMFPNKVHLETQGGARIILDDTKISLEADEVTIRGKKVTIAASAGDVDIQGGPLVKINAPGMPSARLGDPVGGMILNGSSTVLVGGPSLPCAVEVLPGGALKVGHGLIIQGDPAFQAQTLAGLHEIALTPTGRDLLQSIDGSGRTVTIEPTSGGNVTGYTSPEDRFQNPDGSPGSGTNAIVGYNPNTTTIGTEPWETRPPALGLGHELVHADQAVHGTMLPGTASNDSKPNPLRPNSTVQTNVRELDATGIPPHDTRPFNENRLRSEWHPPQPSRDWY
ncbi:type VI secretion system tip protein TssI/VgrG [Chondromyces apiculatus]|uniref:type VI secretion system tip protein TssI/VgrG n=1 Tax=Chondromyces apiculatus TaxID=51 RepID=UPI001E5A4AA4|nr:type VI secretion system tip protein TssI/VgrG [Chondromyces apiculatus]